MENKRDPLISVNPRIQEGRPYFRGTDQVPIDDVLELLFKEESEENILNKYPTLKVHHLQEVKKRRKEVSFFPSYQKNDNLCKEVGKTIMVIGDLEWLVKEITLHLLVKNKQISYEKAKKYLKKKTNFTLGGMINPYIGEVKKFSKKDSKWEKERKEVLWRINEARIFLCHTSWFSAEDNNESLAWHESNKGYVHKYPIDVSILLLIKEDVVECIKNIKQDSKDCEFEFPEVAIGYRLDYKESEALDA